MQVAGGVTGKRLSFKEQQYLAREDAIMDAVNRLLAAKGYDLMTMDEVAAEVGIAKASLYKHFQSKDELAAAAMTRLLDRALAVMNAQPQELTDIDKLRAIVRWSIEVHLRGEMPLLPSTRSTIRQALVGSRPYLDRLERVTAILGGWIAAGQAAGRLSADLPAELILYTIFARSCDPVADFLKQSGAFSDADIVELLLTVCFRGIRP